MDDRMGLNSTEGRELKLGTTFSSHHNAFHTLKYDFKPASVDLNKEATVDVGTGNQVQVTVPHLDGSGVPKTVFKGNQKNYTKECVLIIDKTTGEITLEKLSHNISVKKTRAEPSKSNGQMGSAAASSSSSGVGNSNTGGGGGGSAVGVTKLNENSTQRTVSKTKVSTGVRKTNNAITGYMPRHSPNQLQLSVDYPHHKSPQSAPAWNANNGQSTLPSIPIIDDDVTPIAQVPYHNHHHSSSTSTSSHHSQNSNQHHQQSQQQQQQPQIIHQQQQQQQQIQPQHNAPPPQMTCHPTGVGGGGTELMSSSDSSSESSYSSDSDSSHHSGPTNNVKQQQQQPPPAANLLKEDLCLSDSNSDSD